MAFSLVGRRRILGPTIVVIIGVVTWRFVGIFFHVTDYSRGMFYLRPDFRMDSILVGCAVALYFDREARQSRRNSALAHWGTHPIWIVPALLGWALYCEIPPLRPIYLTVETLLVCGLVFHLIAFPNSAIDRLLRQRWICVVGLVSYSLYLWQQLFLVTSQPRRYSATSLLSPRRWRCRDTLVLPR